MVITDQTDEKSFKLAPGVSPKMAAAAIHNADRVRTVHTVVRGIDPKRMQSGTQFVPLASKE